LELDTSISGPQGSQFRQMSVYQSVVLLTVT